LTLTGPIGTVPEILVAYISSVIPTQAMPTDILLDPSQSDHKSANLKVISVVRLHKLATLHTSSLARQLGMMPPQLMPEVSTKLKLLLKI
jgi:mRNA-degrading endonuclease toxin of MazEF toxin-antitoxin module